MTRRMTVTLPDGLVARLEAQAEQVAHRIEEIITHTIARGLVMVSDPDLTPAVQAELAAMETLTDTGLWEIAGGLASSDTVAVHDLLTQRQHDGLLTAAGQEWLERARADADLLMLRKAHAYLLLSQRGQRLPAIEDLPLP